MTETMADVAFQRFHDYLSRRLQPARTTAERLCRRKSEDPAESIVTIVAQFVKHATRKTKRWCGCRGAGFLPAAASLVMFLGCASPGERAKIVKENDTLRREVARLQRVVTQRNDSINALGHQVENLKGFTSDRPADLFAPVKLEIASLSGGADYDGEPGDDGVTVYLRPRDADGDPVKAPGRITVQLIDNSKLDSPRLLSVQRFDDPEELRTLWHSRFATQHYTLKCRFDGEVALPALQRVTVSVEFVDYLTGRTLTAVKEVPVSTRGE